MLKKIKLNNNSLIKQIIIIALPIIIQQLLLSSYSFVNIFLVSKINEESLIAVGLAFSYEAFVNCLFFAITSGLSIFIINNIQEKKLKEASNNFYLMILINLSLSFFWILISHFFTEYIFNFFSNHAYDKNLYSYFKKYLRIICFYYIFMGINQAYYAMFRNIKKTYIPLIIISITTILNIFIASLIIKNNINYDKLKLLAMAMIFTNFIESLLFIVISLKYKDIFYNLKFSISIFKYSNIFEIIKKIYPIIINELLIGLSFPFYTKLFYQYNDIFPSYLMADRISYIFFNTSYGLSNAVSVIIGSNTKSKNCNEEKKLIFASLIYGIIIVLLMVIFAPSLLNLYKNPTKLAKIFIYILTFKVLIKILNIVILTILKFKKETKKLLFIDGVFEWLLGVLLVYLLINVFEVKNFISVLLLSQFVLILRLIVGYNYIFKKPLKNLNKN